MSYLGIGSDFPRIASTLSSPMTDKTVVRQLNHEFAGIKQT